ncbi:MAG: DUF6772 family protein [Caldilineaceae bacterium]
MSYLHLQCNDRAFDVSGIRPMSMPASANLWCMLNTGCSGRDRPGQARFYVDSVLLSTEA